MNKERNIRHNLLFFTVIGIGVVLIIISVIFVFAGGKDSYYYSSSGLDLKPALIVSDGSQGEAFFTIAHHKTYTAVVPAGEVINRELCIEGQNISFSVIIDGRTVYSYIPELPKLYGTMYGTFYHMVRIPSAMDARTIVIECAPTSTSTSGHLMDVRLIDGVDYQSFIYSKNLGNFVLSIFMTALGALLFVCGLALMTTSNIGREIASMGIFTVVAALWSSTEASYLQISTGNPSAVHFMGYVCLMLLPGAASGFIGYFTDNEESILIRIIPAAATIVCLMAMVLTYFGIADYHSLLPATHLLLLITVMLGGYYTLLTIFKKNSKNSMVLLLLAFGFVALGGIVDIARYYLRSGGSDTAMFFRYGLLVFVLIMSIHEVGKIMSFRAYEAEADNMRNLALTDALTGLSNRMAFTEYKQRLDGRNFGHVLIVQLDVNYLKKVNDNYGHSEGDTHIEAAANVIRDAFGEYGAVFRSGGDEFIVVIEGEGAKAMYDTAIKKMNKCIGKYNNDEDPIVKLEIAYGMAEYDIGKGNAEDTLKKADNLMYQMKKQMKRG